MDEDRLTPQTGRLIDFAKAAAARAAAEGSRAPGQDASGFPRALGEPSQHGARTEGVALLAGDGAVYAGSAMAGPGRASAPAAAALHLSAAAAALGSARQAGCTEIVAAAVAVANDPAATLFPGSDSRRALAGIDEDLPLVVKHRGRWVLLLLSQLPAPEEVPGPAGVTAPGEALSPGEVS